MEGAFSICPGQPNRANIHGHAIANGNETNTRFLAESLYAAAKTGLIQYGDFLGKTYYPTIKVLKIPSAADLQQCIRYTEKIISVKSIVDEAMAQSEAKLPDGDWDPEYVGQLHVKMYELVNEDIPEIFTGFQMHGTMRNLRRRKTAGNMRFGDSGKCIGSEPSWHIKWRRKKSRENKVRRAKKRAIDEKDWPTPPKDRKKATSKKQNLRETAHLDESE